MLFGTYQFLCRLETDAYLPLYKGSTLRGVFGHGLKRVVCALRRQECATCLLKHQCLYAEVFETRHALDIPENLNNSAPPHPYVLEPPLERTGHLSEGESFTCTLRLFGPINEKLPYFVYAFDQMGKIGIGKKINGRRAGFVLEQVCTDSKVLYHNKDGTLQSANAAQRLCAQQLVRDVEAANGAVSKLTVHLETPLRVKFENRLHARLPFHVLVRAMLRRISSLYNTYTQGEPALDYKGLVAKAEAVDTVENDLRWFDWRRYSNRQEQKMYMGGMVGSVTYKGAIGPYLPLIRMCEKVHVGKGTSFGLGKIKGLKI
ncbi:MAG: CRISPR system precrRNA processing endoribonuclease RAMP protein Cas6 [Deltaproteobacteria bacterium]|nr:CRISPR system precrRNA processing endoribonuclease RAMP protein Cas6 [Deltaproteobacteria bacterium]